MSFYRRRKPTWKELAAQFKRTAEQAASSVSTDNVESKAQESIDDLSNQVETLMGAGVNQIRGGVQSLSSKVDQFGDTVNNAVTEGLITDNVKSLENMTTNVVNDATSTLTSKVGTSVTVAFSDPDSNGISYPISSSLDGDAGVADTISGVLGTITGLGVSAGSLQKAVIDGSPEGLLNAGKNLLEGKLSAYTSTIINGLTNDFVVAVNTELQGLVGTVPDINRTVTYFDSVGFDSAGALSTSTATVTSVSPTNDSEFNTSINTSNNAVTTDVAGKITKDAEVKQTLTRGKSDFENLSGGKDANAVITSAQNQRSTQTELTRRINEANTRVRTRIAKNGNTGILQELSTETLSGVREEVQEFAPALSVGSVNLVIALSQGDAQDFSRAVSIIDKVTNYSYNEIKTFLKTIDTTITNTTRPEIDNNVFAEPYVIGSRENQWEKGLNDPEFPYVTSTEELQAELRNVTRNVTEIVVHWTETPTNKNITATEINRYHLQAGLDGCGYHYIIQRDGSLQRGRPVNIEGQHAETNNHNSRSIGIVFVGGINVPSGTPNLENFLSVQSLTRSQFNTFDHLCRTFYNVFPGGQVIGHNDIDATQVDPDFDVRAYVKSNFGKVSLFDDTFTQEPFTVDEIND